MKNITLLLLLLSIALPARATLMEVTGVFSGVPQNQPPAGSVQSLSGGFTAYYDDALVSTTGNFFLDNLVPADIFLSDPLIGATLFDETNTFLDLGFKNGTLISFSLGDVMNNMLGTGADDFGAYFENNGSFLLSQIGVSTKDPSFLWVDFRFNDPSAGSFSVKVASVPDSASTALMGAIGGLALLAFRRRVPHGDGCPA